MKTFQERIGIKSVGQTLTAKSCRERAVLIRKMVERNEVGGDKRFNLLKQAAWYAWKAKQFTKKAPIRKRA